LIPEGLLGDLTGFYEQLDHGLARSLRRTYERTASVAATALGGARGIATAAGTAQGAWSSGTGGEIDRSHGGAARREGEAGMGKVSGWGTRVEAEETPSYIPEKLKGSWLPGGHQVREMSSRCVVRRVKWEARSGMGLTV
jgi:hypothetical protein